MIEPARYVGEVVGHEVHVVHDRLYPVSDAELGVEPADVGLGGRLPDVHRGRDLAVAQTVGQQLECFALAFREIVRQCGGDHSGFGLPSELLDQSSGDRR